MACKTEKELLEWFIDWDKCYLADTDYSFFDGMLFDYIISTEWTGELCVYIGESHAKKVSVLLATLYGKDQITAMATQIAKVTCIGPGLNYEEEFPRKLSEGMDRFLESIRICCQNCAKTEQLQRCTVCKEVWYCGRACQVAAWAEHKIVCKPVKVLV